jgi:hypothetical protein
MTWDHHPDYSKRPLGPRIRRGDAYDGFGRCIYCCKTPTDGLGREHIIPSGLGGQTVILNASCHQCEKVTHAFEGHTLHSAFLLPRLHTKLKKTEPQKLSLNEMRAGVWTAKSVAPLDYPVFGHFPQYVPAHALLGIPPSPIDGSYAGMIRAVIGKHSGRGAKVEEGTTAEHIKIHLGEFSRTISKIAYCFAVVHLGLDAFRSLVPDYIRGCIELGSNYFVGTNIGYINQKDPEHVHRVDINYVDVGGVLSVVGTVRLFAMAGAPEYHVYLGPATRAGWVDPGSPAISDRAAGGAALGDEKPRPTGCGQGGASVG